MDANGMAEFIADLERSRAKYPNNAMMFDGLIGEVDELRLAYAGVGDVRAEAFDVAVCAFRIATEGDAGGNALVDTTIEADRYRNLRRIAADEGLSIDPPRLEQGDYDRFEDWADGLCDQIRPVRHEWEIDQHMVDRACDAWNKYLPDEPMCHDGAMRAALLAALSDPSKETADGR